MHMADALLNPAAAGTMYACSAVAVGYSVHKLKKADESLKIPEMGIMGAFVFAAQMINFTIPGTGSSGHLCGGMLLSAMLGPYAGFLTMAGILLIQCLLFADGGLMALGANIWNMAFFGCFVGAALIWKQMMKHKASRKKIVAASMIGCVLTLQLGAFCVTIETLVSGVTELPFIVFTGFMQPIHLAIGLVEGIITAAVLCFVYEARPELLWGISEEKKEGKMPVFRVLLVLVAAAVLTAGAGSLAASALPDGLEWSMERTAGSTELERSGGIYDAAAAVQDKTSLLPDYAFPDSDSPVGTSFSGLAGGIVVAGVCAAFCLIIRHARRRKTCGNE